MRWLSDIEGCFFTYYCPPDHRFRRALNLLRPGVKDWWRLVTSLYSLDRRTAVTWEKFLEIFRSRYVPMVERGRLAQDYLDVRQGTESVMEITKIFMERATFFL